MNKTDIIALHKKYAENDEAFDLVYTHCTIVAEIAMDAVERNSMVVDSDILYQACMLHDIGTYVLFQPSLHTFKKIGYRLHAPIGAMMLADEGLDEKVVEAVRTHVMMGLSKQEIIDHGDMLPQIDFTTQSLEAELVCYADRFHSKNPQFNDPDTYLKKLQETYPIQAKKFHDTLERFGCPDISMLAAKYGHPVR